MAGLVIHGTYGPGIGGAIRTAVAAVALATRYRCGRRSGRAGSIRCSFGVRAHGDAGVAGLWAERSTVDRVVAWVRPRREDAASALFVGPADAVDAGAARCSLPVNYQPIGFVDAEDATAQGQLGT